MSQENVEIVRAGMEAWNARDMDALRETYAEDVVTWPPDGLAGGGPIHGPRHGHRPVGAHARVVGRRRGGDARELHRRRGPSRREDDLARQRPWPRARAAEATGIFTIRNGKIRVAEFFWDHAEALEALGLSE